MKIAIIYHSETGNTEQMAELVKQGCEGVSGVEAPTVQNKEVA